MENNSDPLEIGQLWERPDGQRKFINNTDIIALKVVMQREPIHTAPNIWDCLLIRKAPTAEYPEGQWIEGYGPAPIQCPNCNNTGGYPIPDGDGDWQEEQCEFCWTEPNSIFNRTR